MDLTPTMLTEKGVETLDANRRASPRRNRDVEEMARRCRSVGGVVPMNSGTSSRRWDDLMIVKVSIDSAPRSAKLELLRHSVDELLALFET